LPLHYKHGRELRREPFADALMVRQIECGRGGQFVRPHETPNAARIGQEAIDLLEISGLLLAAGFL
jgi:hypothetical protein